MSASGPISVSANGQVIENKDITVTNGIGININGFSGVKVRNVRVRHFGTGEAMRVQNAPDCFIGDDVTKGGVYLDKPDRPSVGFLPSERNGLFGNNSVRMRIYKLRSDGFSACVYLVNCDSGVGRFCDLRDARGPGANMTMSSPPYTPVPSGSRGQNIQWNSCASWLFEDFYCFNDRNKAFTEDCMNVYDGSNFTIRRGIVDGNNSPTGWNVIIETGPGVTAGCLVEDVDAYGWACGAFNAYDTARNTIFRRCHASDSYLGNPRLPPFNRYWRTDRIISSLGLAFACGQTTTGTRYEQCKYWNLANAGNVIWDAQAAAFIDISKVQFAKRTPIVLTDMPGLAA